MKVQQRILLYRYGVSGECAGDSEVLCLRNRDPEVSPEVSYKLVLEPGFLPCVS